MTVTTSDVAATTTASAAMSAPWWLVNLPEIAAIVVAPLGVLIALFTLAIKYNEWKVSRVRAREAEIEERQLDSTEDAECLP